MPTTVKVKIEKVCSECGASFTGRSNSKVCSKNCAFWRLVDKSGGSDACWPWTCHISRSSGYGDVSEKYSPDGRRGQAHRIAWWLANICDPDLLYVLHKCDNKLCCNPAHLFIGSQRVNILDAWRKGRLTVTAPGEHHPRANLTDRAVREIRAGGTIAELAKRFGVTSSTIRSVQRRATWRHVA